MNNYISFKQKPIVMLQKKICNQSISVIWYSIIITIKNKFCLFFWNDTAFSI